MCLSDSQPKSCTIFVTQPGVLSVYAEWTNQAASVGLALIFGARVESLGPIQPDTGDEYARVGLTIVVYAVTFTCLLQCLRLWRINSRVLFGFAGRYVHVFLPSEVITKCDYYVFTTVCGLVVQSVCGFDHTILCCMSSDHSTLFQMEGHLPFPFPFLKSC